MPKGGYRPFSGPRKGARYLKALPPRKLPAGIVRAAQAAGLAPLAYMLAVMRDPDEPRRWRDLLHSIRDAVVFFSCRLAPWPIDVTAFL